MFRSQYLCNTLKKGLDYSSEYVDQYVEIPPFSVDKNTGDVINKSKLPVLKKVGKINIQEKIQSYSDECDIYKILERFALTDDVSYITKNVCSFGDVCDLPNNINDYNTYMQAYFDKLNRLSALDKNLSSKILDSKISVDEINRLIDEKLKSFMIKDGE